MRSIVTILFTFSALWSSAQEIAGRVLDEKKQELINATVRVFQGKELKGEAQTDYDGFYVVKPLDPGAYTAVIYTLGYDTAMITDIMVSGGATRVNINLNKTAGPAKCIITKYHRPLVDPNKTQILHTCGPDRIPDNKVTDIAATTNPYQQPVKVLGDGPCPTKYVIDGIVVRTQADVDRMNCYYESLIKFPAPGTFIFTREELSHMPALSLRDVAGMLPGVYQQRRGGPLSIFGSRYDGVKYIVDGMQ